MNVSQSQTKGYFLALEQGSGESMAQRGGVGGVPTEKQFGDFDLRDTQWSVEVVFLCSFLFCFSHQ